MSRFSNSKHLPTHFDEVSAQPVQDVRSLAQILEDQFNWNLQMKERMIVLEAQLKVQKLLIDKLRKDLDEKKYGLFD